MRYRQRTYEHSAASGRLAGRKSSRRFPPFFMNISEYRSLLNCNIMKQKHEFKNIVAETLLIPLYMRTKKSRRELIPEQPDNVYIAASLLETDWMDDLRRKHPDAEFIFIVEGVLMYFYEKQVKDFLHNVASRFAGGELWFDVCGTMMSRHGVKPDSLRKHEAQIRSGLSDGHMVEQWEPALLLIKQANYMKFFRLRWGFFFGQILGRIPWLCYKFSSLLGYRILSK